MENIVYVDIEATEGGNDGSSWVNAYTDLQSALAVAGASDQIWVAEGTYLPVTGNNLPEGIEDPREVSFTINNGVKVYGGFVGNETSLEQRDRIANQTILSGNIGEEAQGDNSYNVIDITDSPASTVIDGFTITGGQADGDGGFARQIRGGGIFAEENGSASIINSTVINNFASDQGGGIFTGSDSSINVLNSVFVNNSAGDSGGAIAGFRNSNPNITNSLFHGNESQFGGAIFTRFTNDIEVFSSTFVNNSGGQADSIGVSDNNEPIILNNSIFWNTEGSEENHFDFSGSFSRRLIINNSIVQGDYQGEEGSEGNITEDPLFSDPANNDFRLRLNSPGIDAGDTEALPNVTEDTEVNGNPRIYNETVDIGSVEYGLYLDVNDVTVTEGNEGTNDATFTITLQDTLGQPAMEQISVAYATADDTATVGTDFTATSGTLIFSPGDIEQTITVPVSTDTLSENDETFLVNLSNPTGNAVVNDNQGVGIISNDDVIREGDPVFRLLNPGVGVHFYTTDVAERDEFIASGNYDSEGASFTSVDPATEGAEEVYRFFNASTGVHLYTTQEKERDFIRDNLSEYTFEGEVFNAYTTEIEGSIPVFRFFNSSLGVHFYTPNAKERDFVEENLPNYQSEGIAYYAFPLEDV